MLFAINSFCICKSQAIYAGGNFGFAVKSKYTNNAKEIRYTFSTTQNEIITVGNIIKTVNLSRSFPEAFVRYAFKNNFFIQSNFNGYIIRNTIEYKAVTSEKVADFSYNLVKKTDNVPLRQDLSYLNLSFTPGFQFLRVKRLQPYLAAGLVYRRLLGYNLAGGFRTITGRENRNEIVYQSLNTHRWNTFAIKAIAGIRFHDIHFDFNFENSLGKLDNTSLPYYDNFQHMYLTIGYDFFIKPIADNKRKK